MGMGLESVMALLYKELRGPAVKGQSFQYIEREM